MNVFEEFKRLVSELERQAVRYVLVGGVAMAFYTEPRFTRDIDLLVDCEDFRKTKGILEKLSELYDFNRKLKAYKLKEKAGKPPEEEEEAKNRRAPLGFNKKTRNNPVQTGKKPAAVLVGTRKPCPPCVDAGTFCRGVGTFFFVHRMWQPALSDLH